jgi:mono/diheme cytochrome c family protein
MNENQPQNFDSNDLDRLHAAVKLWVWAGTWVVMIIGGGYIGANAHIGGFDFEKSNPFAGKPVDVRPIEHGAEVQLDPFQLAMKKGSSIYNNCQGCHQATGLGQPGLIPPLAGSEWVLGGTERIARIAMHGLMGPVSVKSANFNGVMQPPPMSDTEISAVLTYVRNSWGNQAPMVTKEMIAKVREVDGTHPGPWQAADLEKFKDKNCPGVIPAGPGANAAPAAAPAAK